MFCLAGCSASTNELDRYAISGEVTFKGQPVKYGTLTLEPDAQKGNTGPASMAEIKDGKFMVDATRGILGGAYVARLTGYGDAPESTGADTSFGEPLFNEREVRLELPAEKTTYSFEITPEGN